MSCLKTLSPLKRLTNCRRDCSTQALEDQAVVDQVVKDLAVVDLAVEDLAVVDQAVEDLAVVKQAVEDQAVVDLAWGGQVPVMIVLYDEEATAVKEIFVNKGCRKRLCIVRISCQN